MRRRLLWIVLIGLGLAAIVLVASHDRGTIAGLRTEEFGSLVYHVALVAFIGGAVLVMFRERLSHAIEAALFWTVLGFVLVFMYSYRAEIRAIGDRVLSELMPGRATVRSARTVEIVRGRGGDFQVAAQVNGSRVTMVLDFEGHGIGKLLVPLVVRRQAASEMPKNQQKLKQLLESGA